jgi:eukaryotic-like serine/threonine-protein kinase
VRLAPGTRVGPYEVVATLGSGGMAEVYRARDSRLQREVALKVVGETLSGDGAFLARLEHEARLAGSLNHPNIVAVHDVGSYEGAPYVVTELLEGETLRQRLSHGRPPLSSALDWSVQIARGLGAAHEHGIVHRDLKPENVFLTRSGHVKLLDFGIAKAVLASTSSHDLLEPTLSPAGDLTRTGAVLGTPGYMSPEQVRGGALDARSDIFSLGAILYELLSGRRAFPGASVVESGHAILHDDPLPLPEAVPTAVAQIVRRCLEKDPDQRFRSAQDVGFALDAFRTARGTMPSVDAGWSRLGRRRLAIALASAAVLAAVMAALVSGRRTDQPGRLETRPLTFRRGMVLAARFAPDGRTVHYSAAWSGAPPQVFSTTIDSPESRPLGIGDANLLSVSPSGEVAVALRPYSMFWDRMPGTLARAPAMGGLPRELTGDVDYADWAPDGESLALARVESETSQLEFPVGKVLFRSTGWVSHPRISPGGERVAFIDHDLPAESRGRVRVVDSRGTVETWSPLFDHALGLAWAPGGAEVLLSGMLRPGEMSSLWILRREQEPTLLYRAPVNLILADASPDGRLLVVVWDWRIEVELWTGEPRNVTPEWTTNSGPAVGLSDDGNTVLMSEYGRAPGLQSFVSLWDRRQSVATRLGKGRPLALSPDGRWVLIEEVDHSGKLVLLPTRAGNPKQLGESGLAFISAATFFKDGKRIALLGRRRADVPNQVWELRLEGGALREISAENVETAGLPSLFVSPDQHWVATSLPDGTVTAYGIEGGEPIRVLGWGTTHMVIGWLADGRLLAHDRFKVPSPVEAFDLRSRTIHPFTTLMPSDPTGVQRLARVQVTPDGRTVAFAFERSNGILNLLEWKLAR